MMNNKNKEKENNFKIHVMPPQISDEDINALFKGIVNVVKKKFELEKNAETLNLNFSLEKLQKELKDKKAEIIRLKNEIIYLKSKMQEK